MTGYFSFHKLVSTSVIKATYVIGIVLITFWGLGMIGFGIASLVQPDILELRNVVAGQPVVAVVIGAITLVFGNLLWRLLCEGWILLFSMHELLAAIAHGSGQSFVHVGSADAYVAGYYVGTRAADVHQLINCGEKAPTKY